MNKKIFTSILAVIMIITCVLAFAACNNTDPGNDLKAPDKWPKDITDGFGFTNEYLEPTEVLEKPSTVTDLTFILDWAPNTNHTGLYVALDKGYFRDENLNVTFIQPGNTGTSAAVSAGTAQFGIDFQEQMIFHEMNNINVTAIAAIIQHNTSGLLRKKTSNIPTIDKMAGKKYATWSLPGEQVIVKHAINVAGGNYNDVQFIPNTVENIIAEFKNTSGADCVWSYAGWDNIKLDLAGIDYDFNVMQEFDPRLDYYTPVIIGNNDYMKANPAVAQAFVRAVKKGYEFCATDPMEAAQCLIRCNDGYAEQEQLITLSALFLKERYKGDAPYWGHIDAKRWDGFNDLMVELGKYDTTFI